MKFANPPFWPREIATQIVLLVVLSAVIFHLCINAAFFIGRRDSPPRGMPGGHFGYAPPDFSPPGMRDSERPPPNFWDGPPPTLGPQDRLGRHGPHGPPVSQLVFGTLLFIAVSFTIFLVWAVYGLTRPLRRFAEALDAFTPEGGKALLEENGPSELCAAARALNRMHERVAVMLDQRTRMLAAVSHDLRTPVTRLRLRAEFIEPSDVRDAILRDLEQMNAMIHSALSFIRDGVEAQRSTLLDLGALLQTISDEFVDLGHKVHFEMPMQIFIKGNVDELYRAITNLVGNAVQFGTDIEIRLHRREQNHIAIDVVDDGPGIADERKADMLAPFVRGDDERKSDGLQGFGLGLPIAHAIVAAHQGSLELLDRAPRGLIARITLPA